MKRLFFILILSFISSAMFSQSDKQAKQILDKTFETINSSNGIKLDFKGSNSGLLMMKRNKFYLQSSGIETWFDGKTQWSYVKGNDEVNITEPSQEELQSVNPYYLLSSYKKGYNYKYAGEKNIAGKRAKEIILTPQKKSSISSITLYISANYQPLMIRIKERNNSTNEFTVSQYNSQLNYNDSMFKFNKHKNPKAEVIDLR